MGYQRRVHGVAFFPPFRLCFLLSLLVACFRMWPQVAFSRSLVAVVLFAVLTHALLFVFVLLVLAVFLFGCLFSSLFLTKGGRTEARIPRCKAVGLVVFGWGFGFVSFLFVCFFFFVNCEVGVSFILFVFFTNAWKEQ